MSTGGYALHGYNEGSLYQRTLLMKLSDVFMESLEHARSSTSEQIVIADYGSSEGYNSMVFLRRALSKIRENSFNQILVIHNDLPENEWTKTFKTILESEESYLKLPNVYFLTVGRSFYDQILPNNSVHIGFTSAAFHWLSQPLSAPDHAIPSSSSDPDFKNLAYSLAHDDLVILLRNRHKELTNSGQLIVQILLENSPIINSFGAIINTTVENAFRKGYITEDEKRSITVPWYGRSYEEIQRALNEISDLYKVISFPHLDDNELYFDNLPEEIRVEIMNELKNLEAYFLKGALQRAIKRNEEEKNAIYVMLITELFDVIDTSKVDRWPTFQYFVLEKNS
ncbi:unnamed protein product [Blepharisma stoltei]|uniref:Uncharacterized protein n=1 Tax=Blepharisma stoltei TaxID=1481888 RepID=A0AAU9K9H1_9CILI|nr:unnamed protein product [Blepharisma stoltei]